MSGVRTLGRPASFWVATAVVAHTLWTSAAPSMTYRLYASEWSLTHTVTTAIFAVFPIVVVSVLMCFGDISGYIRRRTTMLVGLASSLLGTVAFAISPRVLWIFVGRAFIGVGVGLSASPASAAMLEFSATGQSGRASSFATLAQAIGLASATLVGGEIVGQRRYVQSRTIANPPKSVLLADFDGVAQVWFDDIDGFHGVFSSPNYRCHPRRRKKSYRWN